MVIADYTMREIERKAKAGIAMDKPNEAKIKAYNSFAPNNTFYNQPVQQQQQQYKPLAQPDFNLNTQDGSAWFINSSGDGQRIEKDNVFSTLGSMQQSLNNAMGGKNDSLTNKYQKEIQNYMRQLGEQGLDFANYDTDFTKYSQHYGNTSLGLSGDWNRAYEDGQYGDIANYMQRDMGIGNNVDFRFNDWDNYEGVMKQLNASATALGVLNKDQSIHFDDVKDLYSHYLNASKRASELGYGGIVSPGWKTGYTDGRDYLSAFDRGFGQGGAVQDQWAQLGQLGTEEGAKMAQIQKALDSLVALDAVQREYGTWRYGNYDFDGITGDRMASHELQRGIEYLKKQGLVDEDYDAHSDGARGAIENLLELINSGKVRYNDYNSSNMQYGNFSSTKDMLKQPFEGYGGAEYAESPMMRAIQEHIEGSSTAKQAPSKSTPKVNEQQKALAEAIERYLKQQKGALL